MWLTDFFAPPTAHNKRLTTRARRLWLESLESREVPAITVQLDYSYDASGFFNDPSRRAILQQAVNDIASHLDANLAAIVPSAGNTWSETFFNPATGQQSSIANPSVGANTLTLYVGGRDIGGPEAGFGGSGGYSASGNQAFLNTLSTRGPGGSLLWGGSITFDTSTNWFFGSSTSGLTGNQVDFLSVAEHEFGHVLGIGTAPRWFSLSSGGNFYGPAAASIYGGPVPESPDGAHFGEITAAGVPPAMEPQLLMGTRVAFSSLDYAGLIDLGWGVSASPPPASPPPASPPPPVISNGPLNVHPVPANSPLLRNGQMVILTGATDGSAQVFTQGSGGTLVAAGPSFQPFPGYTGVIRSTIADFNGDGIADFAFATGGGVAGTVRIIDGSTGGDVVAPSAVLGGFSGGVFIAAGDVDRDGKAELAVSADVGGGPRVTVYKVQNGTLVDERDFIAFGSPGFRGGSRVAMADVNHDGIADLIVGAGIGGGPRVSIYNGNSLLSGNLVSLVPDFFALDPNLRSGVYVTAADVNGDGYADVIYSTGDSGGPRIRVVSGLELLQNPGANVAALPPLADFFALDPNDRQGIRVAARDINGDGKAELIIGSGSKTNAEVRIIPLTQMNFPSNPLQDPFSNPATIDGIYVG
ncbi:MAG TPA: FG-GAP-like repeat-containing protein [Urbifossiella sp.]|nr:FG-GAP-like repeat-containing protein [Urbifossiella sp.]